MGVPYVLDGLVARLSPALGASLALGPGQRGRDAGGSILFAAGAGIWTVDLLESFWRDELPGMNWFADFLCDPATDEFLATLANPPAEEEEPEMMYSKSQLATVGSDVMDEY